MSLSDAMRFFTIITRNGDQMIPQPGTSVVAESTRVCAGRLLADLGIMVPVCTQLGRSSVAAAVALRGRRKRAGTLFAIIENDSLRG